MYFESCIKYVSFEAPNINLLSQLYIALVIYEHIITLKFEVETILECSYSDVDLDLVFVVDVDERRGIGAARVSGPDGPRFALWSTARKVVVDDHDDFLRTSRTSASHTTAAGV